MLTSNSASHAQVGLSKLSSQPVPGQSDVDSGISAFRDRFRELKFAFDALLLCGKRIIEVRLILF